MTDKGNQKLGQAHKVRGVEEAKATVWLWHRRLGHLSFRYLKKLKPHLFSVISDSKCHVCELAKNHRVSFSPSFNKSSIPFMTIHSDIWGPVKYSTMSGAKYFVIFIDECTRMT